MTSKRLTSAITHGYVHAKINGWSINWCQWSKTNPKQIHRCMRMSSELNSFWWMRFGLLLFKLELFWIKLMIRCDHPIEMRGRSFTDMSLKHVGMRCEDYYGHRPERDGPILVGIFIGESYSFSPFYFVFNKLELFLWTYSTRILLHMRLKFLWFFFSFYLFAGLMIGIPITMAALFIYRRGCFGIFGYRPNPGDYGRAFYKRTQLQEDLHI